MRRYKKYAEYPIAQLRIICLTETSLTGELRQPCVYIRNNKPLQVMQNLRRSEFVALRCIFFIEIVCYGHGEDLYKSEFVCLSDFLPFLLSIITRQTMAAAGRRIAARICPPMRNVCGTIRSSWE